MTTNVTSMSGDELDRRNNALQAIALVQYAAGADVTVVTAGDVRYIVRQGGCGSAPDANA